MKKSFGWIIGVVSVLMILWLCLSAFVIQDDYWSIDFSQWITLAFSLILGFIVAYVLVEKNTKQRLLTDRLIAQIETVKKSFEESKKQILTNFTEDNWRIKLLSSTKELSNSITLLKKYTDKLHAKEELEFIDKQFIEYRTIVTDCIDQLKKDATLRAKAVLKSSLIESKFDEIVLKLYNS